MLRLMKLRKVVLLKLFTALLRSSHWRCSVKKGVLKNFAKFTGKHLCRSLFLIKLQAFIKKRLLYRCFPVKFAIFPRTPILNNICERLLLIIALRVSHHDKASFPSQICFSSFECFRIFFRKIPFNNVFALHNIFHQIWLIIHKHVWETFQDVLE